MTNLSGSVFALRERGTSHLRTPKISSELALYFYWGPIRYAIRARKAAPPISRAHLAAFEDHGIVHLLMCDVLREFRSEIDVQVGPRHREAYEVRLTEV